MILKSFQGKASVEQVSWIAPSAGALEGHSNDACVVGTDGSSVQNRGHALTERTCIYLSRRVSIRGYSGTTFRMSFRWHAWLSWLLVSSLACLLVFLIELVMGLHISCVAGHAHAYGVPSSLSLSLYASCMYIYIFIISYYIIFLGHCNADIYKSCN